MASSKDAQNVSRPSSNHRSSLSASSGSLPRPTHSRNHSHSISSATLNPAHRVTRRKSVTSNTASNVAAIVAAVREEADVVSGMPITIRRNTMSKSGSARLVVGSPPSPPSSLPVHRMRMASLGKMIPSESVIDDDLNDDDMDDMIDEDNETVTAATSAARMRRASEGQHLIRDGKKGSGGDLKCEKCGKGYKHSSCLTKHLWEHTPQWSYTSKLLISKHQQVQLLEAASVLLTMNQDGSTPPESTKDSQSDQGSESPAASGASSSDRASSAETTPPPRSSDGFNHTYSTGPYSGRHKRYSSGNAFSRSYQSAPSAAATAANPLHSTSVPRSPGFGHHRNHSSQDQRASATPNRVGAGTGSELDLEEDGLAAAIELLSCSFGSTGSRSNASGQASVHGKTVTLPDDAPPVPNIPARYLDSQSYTRSSELLSPNSGSLHPRHVESYTRYQSRRHEDDQHDAEIKMEGAGYGRGHGADDDEDLDFDHRSRARSDEDDDGVFGHMEE